MDYTRGNDIVSALKYFYQNKYGISTEVLSECRSIPEVICAAEKLQITPNDADKLNGSGVALLNAMGDHYSAKKQSRENFNRNANRQNDKKAKRERSEESREFPVREYSGLIDETNKEESLKEDAHA